MRARAPAVPRLPPRGARLLREDGDLSDHAHGRPEGGAGPGSIRGSPRALYEAFAEAKRLAYRRLADTAVLPYVLPWLVAEVEETRALMGDDPVPLRRQPQPQDRGDPGRLLVPPGPGAAPSRGGGAVLRVAARHVGSRRAGPYSPPALREPGVLAVRRPESAELPPPQRSRSSSSRASELRERERRSDGRAPATQGLSPTEPRGARETSYWQASVEPILAQFGGTGGATGCCR